MTNEANESSTVWEGSICLVVKEKNLIATIVKSVYLQVSAMYHKQAHCRFGVQPETSRPSKPELRECV